MGQCHKATGSGCLKEHSAFKMLVTTQALEQHLILQDLNPGNANERTSNFADIHTVTVFAT
jgi:hypothetical protein